MKLERAPLPGNTVVRPRLVEALATSTAPFTLVVAGPGYGKTVAVTQWLDSGAAPTAWVSLERSDDGSLAFWRGLAESILRATGDRGAEALDMLADEQGPSLVVAALQADLAGTPEPLRVILDDLHVLRDPALLGELADFIERLPPTVRIVGLSRVDPQLPLGRWRAAGRLAEVRQRDLRFTLDEALTLFEANQMSSVAADDIAFLTDRTEGWAAGLQLALLSLRTREDAHDYIHSSLAGDHGIVDYLVGEVLDSLSPEDRELVLDLSILDDFDPALAVAVTGRPDAAQRIRSLEARNLFLLPADERGQRFRFHQLLRDLLVAELAWRAPGRAAVLHVAAADHLVAKGAREDAARHLVAGGEIDRAFQLVVEPAWTLLDQGKVVAARQCLDLLPDGVIGTDADRILSFIVLLTAAGRAEEADRWAVRLEAGGRLVEFEWLQQVQFYGLRSMLEYIRGDLEASQLSLLHCLALLGDVPLQGPVLDRLGGILVRQALDDRRYDVAAYWLEALDHHHSESLVVRDLLPTALRARLAWETGRLGDAERLARHVVEVSDADHLGTVAPVGEARTVLAEVLLEQGRFGEADEHATIATQELGERRLTVGEIRARLVAVAVATARFGPSSGRQLLEATRRAFEHRRIGADVRRWLDAAEARLCLLAGDVEEARRFIDALPASNVRALLVARAALLRGDTEGVRGALGGIVDPSTGEQVEAHILGAQATTGSAALRMVREAADLAIDGGLLHTFLREGAEAVRLARRAISELASPALERLLLEVPAPRSATRDRTFTEPLADRELTLLRLLPTHLTYGEIADQMCVSINTVKTYQKALFRKLNASKRSEAVVIARQAGLLDALA